MPKQDTRSRKFCFTSHSETEPSYDSKQMKYMIYQKEKCPTTEKLHYQGFVYFHNKKSKNGAIKLVPNSHIILCDGTVEQNIAYCSKEESRLGGPWEFGTKPKTSKEKMEPLQQLHLEILDYMKDCKKFTDLLIHPKYSKYLSGKMEWARSAYHAVRNQVEPLQIELNQWQQQLLHKVATQDTPRTVWWIYDTEGGAGKTRFTKYCRHNFNAFTPQLNHKTASFLYDRQELVIIDIPRYTGNELVPYGLIESLKNGYIVSDKYVPIDKEFESPIVIIFSNEYPQIDKLSKDRWRIFNINKKFHTLEQ